MLSVANKLIMLSVIMVNVIMLSVAMLNVVMLSVVMLNVTAPKVQLTSLQYFFLLSLTLPANKLECLDGWAIVFVSC